MNILMVNKFHFIKGGSERHVFDLSKKLEEEGHNVIHFSMKHEQNFSSNDEKYFIDYVDLKKFGIKNIIKFIYNRQAVKKMQEIIKREKIDVVHLHNIAHQIGPAIIKVAKDNNLPIIQTLHDYKLICPNYTLFSKGEICKMCKGGKYYNCVKRKCHNGSFFKSLLGSFEAYLNNKIKNYYKDVDLFIAPSTYMKNACVEFGVSEEKIKVIVNFGRFNNSEEIERENGNEYLLYFGRLSGEKGLNTLIKAMKDENIKSELRLVGAGPEYKNLEKMIEDLDLENKVGLLGPKYGHELKIIIANAKAIVIPSVWPENMPLTMLEALSLGVPVIVSKVGGLREIIKDSYNGISFRAGDELALSEAIKKLDTLDRELLSKNARESVNELNVDNYYKKVFKIYKKCTER